MTSFSVSIPIEVKTPHQIMILGTNLAVLLNLNQYRYNAKYANDKI